MKHRAPTRVLASALIAIMVFPTTFFLLPPGASAQSSGGSSNSSPGCVVGLAAGLSSVLTQKFTAVNTGDAATGVASWTTSGAEVGGCIYNLIVVPLLRQMVRQFLQQMTQRTVDWISGNNSTGQPSFVQDLSLNLQGVADAVAMPVLQEFATAFVSPFGPAIAAALTTNYSQLTSMAGFYAANLCTLPLSSPNVSAFLAGNWSQGGVAAWFALTTQNQNNPYTLYENARNQLAAVIGTAVTKRTSELSWGRGFMSWCTVPGGVADTSVATESVYGASPGDTCTNSKTGASGTIETPGTTIEAYLNKNLGSGIDNLVSAQDLDSAIGAIASALANRVVSESGLLGSSNSSSSSVSGGVSSPPSQSSAASSAEQLAQSVLANANAYSAAWHSISDAANAALADANDLQNSCSAQSSAAQTAITIEISPVLVESQAALTALASSTALATKVQAEARVAPLADPLLFSNEVATLATMPPTTSDVAQAQAEAQVTGAARANPEGSLTVAGGSLVDQMNLISANALSREEFCNGPLQ